jgi:hypothetical protein
MQATETNRTVTEFEVRDELNDMAATANHCPNSTCRVDLRFFFKPPKHLSPKRSVRHG